MTEADKLTIALNTINMQKEEIARLSEKIKIFEETDEALRSLKEEYNKLIAQLNEYKEQYNAINGELMEMRKEFSEEFRKLKGETQ